MAFLEERDKQVVEDPPAERHFDGQEDSSQRTPRGELPRCVNTTGGLSKVLRRREMSKIANHLVFL